MHSERRPGRRRILPCGPAQTCSYPIDIFAGQQPKSVDIVRSVQKVRPWSIVLTSRSACDGCGMVCSVYIAPIESPPSRRGQLNPPGRRGVRHGGPVYLELASQRISNEAA